MENAFRDGFITETCTEITDILPPIDPFASNHQYETKKCSVIEALKSFLSRFLDL